MNLTWFMNWRKARRLGKRCMLAKIARSSVGYRTGYLTFGHKPANTIYSVRLLFVHLRSNDVLEQIFVVNETDCQNMGRKKGGSKKQARPRKTPAPLNSDIFADSDGMVSDTSTPQTPADGFGGRRGAGSPVEEELPTYLIVSQLEEAVTQAQTRRSDLRIDGYLTLIKLLRTNCLQQLEEANLVPTIAQCALSTMKKRSGQEFHLAVEVLLTLSVIVATIGGLSSFFTSVQSATSTRILRWVAAVAKDREDRLRGRAADGRDAADEESSSDGDLVADMVRILGIACFLTSDEASETAACSSLCEKLFTPPESALSQWKADEDIENAEPASEPRSYNWDEDFEDEYNYGSDSDSDGDSDSDSDSESSDAGAAAAVDPTYGELLAGANPVLAQAITSWSLLLSSTNAPSTWTLSREKRQHLLEIMAFWLSHADVKVQTAAANCIGVFHDICGSKLEEDAAEAAASTSASTATTAEGSAASTSTDWIQAILQILDDLRRQSVRRRKKGDRKASRKVFAALAKSLEGERYSGETSVQLSALDTVKITSWESLSFYEALCTALGHGIAHHIQYNGTVVRDILEIETTKAKLTKAEKQAKARSKGSWKSASAAKQW